VTVGGLTPAQQQPAFFLRGWDEAPTEAARAENRERVKTFMTLTQEWESAGLAARVSELNLDDLRDVRAQLAGDDSQIEVRLGSADWTTRLRDALRALDTQRDTARAPFITYIDMTQGKRAVLGFNPHPQAASAPSISDAEAAEANATNGAKHDAATGGDAATPGAKSNEKPPAEQPRRAAADAKRATHAKTEERAAKSDAKSKAEKSGGERRGEQSVGQSRDGGRPRRVTKGE
jgi:Cell division protein FtsQ/DivIB, C-terminal